MLIRVFVDASPHIPEHRQLPLFTHLICTVGSTQFLHTAVILLLEKHIVHGQATSDENQVSVSMRTVLCKCNAEDNFLCLFSGRLDECLFETLGSKDGAVVRGLSSNQFGVDSIPPQCHKLCELSLLLVFALLQGFFSRSFGFPSSTVTNPQNSNSTGIHVHDTHDNQQRLALNIAIN